MREMLFSWSLALLFLAAAVPSFAQNDGAGSVQVVENSDVVYYNVSKNLNLVCPFSSDEKAVHVWKKNGTDIGAINELKDRFEYRNGTKVFFIKRALEDDFGNYSCLVDGQNKTWEVRGNPHPKIPDNSNVVEGQPLKLNCKVIGKPYTRVTWRYSNSSNNITTSEDVTKVFGDRIVLQPNDQNIEDGQLHIKEAQKSDAGYFWCSMGTNTTDMTQLRVKDMYAALWPFLGICAEVFILCAIILIYEKRRTKPELDDSDTDNHDQKKS